MQYLVTDVWALSFNLGSIPYLLAYKKNCLDTRVGEFKWVGGGVFIFYFYSGRGGLYHGNVPAAGSRGLQFPSFQQATVDLLDALANL